MRDSSPPEATRARGARGWPGLALTWSSIRSSPPGPGRLGLQGRDLDRESTPGHAELLHRLGDRLLQTGRRRGAGGRERPRLLEEGAQCVLALDPQTLERLVGGLQRLELGAPGIGELGERLGEDPVLAGQVLDLDEPGLHGVEGGGIQVEPVEIVAQTDRRLVGMDGGPVDQLLGLGEPGVDGGELGEGGRCPAQLVLEGGLAVAEQTEDPRGIALEAAQVGEPALLLVEGLQLRLGKPQGG